jgi:hypothetical protein
MKCADRITRPERARRGRDQQVRQKPATLVTHAVRGPVPILSHDASAASAAKSETPQFSSLKARPRVRTRREDPIFTPDPRNGNHDLNRYLPAPAFPRQPGPGASSMQPTGPAMPYHPPAVTPQGHPREPNRSGDQCRPHCSRRLFDRRSARYRAPDVCGRLADAGVGMAIAFRPTRLPRIKSRAAHAAPGWHRRCADRPRLGLALQVGFQNDRRRRARSHVNTRFRSRGATRCDVCRRGPRRCRGRSATRCCCVCPGCETARDRSDGADGMGCVPQHGSWKDSMPRSSSKSKLGTAGRSSRKFPENGLSASWNIGSPICASRGSFRRLRAGVLEDEAVTIEEKERHKVQ